MSKTPVMILSSATAWVDPSVQVHAVTCRHALDRANSDEWLVRSPYASVDEARPVAEADAQRIKAIDVAYCDCALGLA